MGTMRFGKRDRRLQATRRQIPFVFDFKLPGLGRVSPFTPWQMPDSSPGTISVVMVLTTTPFVKRYGGMYSPKRGAVRIDESNVGTSSQFLRLGLLFLLLLDRTLQTLSPPPGSIRFRVGSGGSST